MITQKERNQCIVVKAFRHLIITGDAFPKTYHIPPTDNEQGYDVTIYKVKGNPSPPRPKGRRTR